MKLRKTYVLFSILLVLLLSACGQQNSEQRKNGDLKKVTIMLDWFPNTNHTGIYVAKEKGYYKENGIDLEILEPGDGMSVEQVVAKGNADFGISNQESVTQARSTDIPIVSIAAIIQENTSAFASLKKSGITSVKQFEGKRYGGWGSESEEAVLRAVMKKHNANYEKIENVTLGATDFFKSIGRDADVEWIFYGWDGIEAKRQGMDLNLIYLKDLDPALNYYTPVIASSEKLMNSDPETVKAFMDATKKGYKDSINNPEEAADLLVKQVPDLNKDLVHKSQDWLSKQYQGNADRWGIQDQEVWENYANWMVENQLLDKKIDTGKAFTNQFIDN
ncbi:ABC transporter substrate-binding protein [Bacillus gobiensis]|uniref:ABC transporter substrate-binding protein n=1 Tax=Bacillus gobiensis TaxID=1441095 RepID=UPI003D2273E5